MYLHVRQISLKKCIRLNNNNMYENTVTARKQIFQCTVILYIAFRHNACYSVPIINLT